MDTVEITAGRLHLRPWLPRDAAEVQAACQDPEIQRWTQVPVPYGPEDARGYVEEISPLGWQAGTDALFAVLDATSGAVLASTGLMHLERGDRCAELGLWVAAGARGRGVGPDSARAVCGWAFATLGVLRVEWLADVDNGASISAARRAGFRAEGVLRSRLNSRGRQVDAWVGSLLPSDPA